VILWAFDRAQTLDFTSTMAFQTLPFRDFPVRNLSALKLFICPTLAFGPFESFRIELSGSISNAHLPEKKRHD
jgi:hypothetical protein